MAKLREIDEFTEEVYQLEVTDFVEGGENGVDNRPHKELANRTKWLKSKIDAFLAGTVKVKNAILADTATKLETPRTINNVAFDGSANINLNGFSEGMFFVGGEKDTFYPVVFHVPTLKLYSLNIWRESVHDDSVWNGNIALKIEGKNNHWGNGANYIDVIKYRSFKKTKCAKVHQSDYYGYVSIWLEGQATYFWEGKNIEIIDVFLDGFTDNTHNSDQPFSNADFQPTTTLTLEEN